MREIECMPLWEYAIRMKAHNLKRIDIEYDIHLQAWVNNKARATKERGKKIISYYERFKEFYDKDTEERKILGYHKDEKQQTLEERLKQIARKQEVFRKMRAGED